MQRWLMFDEMRVRFEAVNAYNKVKRSAGEAELVLWVVGMKDAFVVRKPEAEIDAAIGELDAMGASAVHAAQLERLRRSGL